MKEQSKHKHEMKHKARTENKLPGSVMYGTQNKHRELCESQFVLCTRRSNFSCWQDHQSSSPNHGNSEVKVLVTQLCMILCDPWTVARQAPLSMRFSRQEHWSSLPFPSPRDHPKPRSPALQADSLPSEPQGKPIMENSPSKFSWKFQLIERIKRMVFLFRGKTFKSHFHKGAKPNFVLFLSIKYV